MLNQCNLIGNLGADPEIRTFSDGNKVANIRIAVTEKWKDKNTGERKEKTEWVSVSIFGPLAGVVEQYVKKGSKVFVSGKFQTRKWQDQSGVDKYSSEIVLQGPSAVFQMLDSKSSGDQSGGYSGATVGGGGGGGSPAPIDDGSEIPF